MFKLFKKTINILPSKKEQNKFMETWKWYNHYVKPLETSLENDPEFVLSEVKKVGESKKKPVMYILGHGGFFTPDNDTDILAAEPDERPDPGKLNLSRQGFGLKFMQVMALHGFDQGISWPPTSIDAMHFELVDGVVVCEVILVE